MPTAQLYDLAEARWAKRGASVASQMVGRAVRNLRVATQLSRQRLAERVGLQEIDLLLYETGEKSIPPRMLFMLAEALEVPVSSLLRMPA